MLHCLVKKYIELNREEIKEYIKLIFGRKLDKSISELFENTYIDVRYYNYSSHQKGYALNRKKVVEEFKILSEKLIKEMPKKEVIIRQNRVFYEYILYFDSISKIKNINDKIEKLENIREKTLNLKSNTFKDNVLKIYEKYQNEKKELLEKYENKEFSISLKQYENQRNLIRVFIKSNIKMPKIYSTFAVERAFNSGLIKEDRLIIEYYLVSLNVINDIIKGDFKKHYVLDFADSLLKKPKKIKNILEILADSAIKEKVSLKITYTEFCENRDDVYNLINQGYKLIIYLDDSFVVDFSEMQILNLFSYIVINKNLKKYDEIMDNKVVLSNIVEI